MDMDNILGQIELVKQRLRKLQEKLKSTTVEGEDENNLITAIVSGSGMVIDYKLNTKVMEAINQAQLVKALVESTNNGLKKAKELEIAKKQEILGEFNISNIPGLFDMEQLKKPPSGGFLSIKTDFPVIIVMISVRWEEMEMKRLTTFEDVFNKLTDDYMGQKVEVETRQDNLNITNFTTTIDDIIIKPLNKMQGKKWNKEGKKVGLIVFKEKSRKVSFNIPFILGFNTMNAVFLKNGVIIKSLNMEFIIKMNNRREKRLA